MARKPWTKQDYLDWAHRVVADVKRNMPEINFNIEQMKRFDPQAAALVQANTDAAVKLHDHLEDRLEPKG